MGTRKLRLFLIGIVAAAVIAGFAIPVSAVVSTDVQTDYAGGQAGTDQAVNVTYTISPEDSEITDVRLDFSSTPQSFIDGNSFSYTITPGGADADVESDGTSFTIDSLEPNEEVRFTFKVYPKTIKQESLGVATIDVNYVQNGQQLSKTDDVSTDLSTSPWFQYQDALDRIDSIQQGEQFGLVTVAGSVLVGAVGLVTAAFFWRRADSRVKSERETFVEELQARKSKFSSKGKHEIDKLIDRFDSDGPTRPGGDDGDDDTNRPPKPPGS